MDAFRALGLSEDATQQDIKNRWKEISRELTKGRAASIPEEEKLQILADAKKARDEALRAIENMPLSTKVKNIVIQKLNELTTGISRKFTGLRPAKNLPVEQRFTKEPLTSVESFIKRIETIKPEQAPEQITAQEIAGLLMDPSKTTSAQPPDRVDLGKPILLPGEVDPGEPILLPGEVVEPEAIKDYVETEKFGKLKILDDSDPSLVKVQNEQGTVFKIGKKALREQVKISTPEDIAKAFGEMEDVALGQSATLPSGKYIALDKPFQNEAHDASQAEEEELLTFDEYKKEVIDRLEEKYGLRIYKGSDNIKAERAAMYLEEISRALANGKSIPQRVKESVKEVIEKELPENYMMPGLNRIKRELLGITEPEPETEPAPVAAPEKKPETVIEPKPVKNKEPWEMTIDEYVEHYRNTYEKNVTSKRNDEGIKALHKDEIIQAAFEGKKIPDEVIEGHPELKNTISYIQSEIETEEIIENYQDKMATIEAQLHKPTRIDSLAYRLAQLKVGDITLEEFEKDIKIAKSGASNEYGSDFERHQMINDIIEKMLSSNKNFIKVKTPNGVMHLRNDASVLAKVLNNLGLKDNSGVMTGRKIEIITPNIDKSKLAIDQYYTQLKVGNKTEVFQVVGAKPFGIPGTEDLDLFRYQPSKQPDDFPIPYKEKGWYIIDGKTGIYLTKGSTLQKAAKELKEIIDKFGIDEVKKRLEDAAKEYGLSPRYSGKLSDEARKRDQDIYEARKIVSKMRKMQDPEMVPDTEPVTRQEIEEFINLEMEVPFRYGKLNNNRTRGQYHRLTQVIRTRDYSDNEVTGHEMGHHITNVLKLIVEEFPELPKLLAEEGLAGAYPPELHFEEGAAEFFKYYFTNPSVAVMKAPNFAAYVEQRLQEVPEFNRKVKNLQNLMVRWEQQPARERIAGSIAKRPSEQRKLLSFKDKLMANWVAEDVVMRRALEEAGIDWEKDLEITQNPVKLRRLFASVNDKIDTFLTKRTLDPYGRPYMESLLDILAPVKDYIGEGEEVGDFEVYALAKHALEREARYIANNLNPGVVLEAINAGLIKGEGDKFSEHAEEFKEMVDLAIAKDGYNTLVKIVKFSDMVIGKATGLRIDDILEIIKPYEEKYPEFKKTLKKLDKYQNNLVDYLVSRGMLTQSAGQRIKSSYSFHMPLYRLFGAGESYFEGTGGNKYANLPNPLKRAYGSTRIIKDPIRNIIRDTVYVIRQGDKNRITASLIKALERSKGTGWLVEDVPLPKEPHQFALEQVKEEMKAAGLEEKDIENLDLDVIATVFETQYYAGLKEHRENVVMVRQNGKIKAKVLHPELYEFLQGLDIQTSTIMDKLLKPIEIGANIFKGGAVLDPRFWIRNMGRDEFREAIFRENGLEILKIGKPIIDGVAGLAGLSKEDTEAIFRGAGGARAGFFNLIKDIDNPDTVTNLLKSKDFSWNPLDWLSAASSWTEDIRRRGYFVQELKGVDLNKLSPEEFEKKVLGAAYKSRGGILEDYGIKGKYSRVLNRFYPFFSAGVTGVRHFIEKLKAPMAWLKGFAFITVPSILLYMEHRDKPEYQELPQWRKVFAWNWITNNGTIISFPKPFSPGIFFGSIPEMVLE